MSDVVSLLEHRLTKSVKATDMTTAPFNIYSYKGEPVKPSRHTSWPPPPHVVPDGHSPTVSVSGTRWSGQYLPTATYRAVCACGWTSEDAVLLGPSPAFELWAAHVDVPDWHDWRPPAVTPH